MRRLTLWLLIAAGSWATACGGRTGDDLPLGVGGSGTGAMGAVGGFGGAGMGGIGAYGGAGMGGIGAYGGAGMGGMGAYGGAGYGGGGYGGAGMGGIGAYGGAGYGGGGYGGAGMGGMGAFGGGGYGGAPTDCCYPKGSPGCVPPEIAKCVCAQDGYCCTTAWDQLCVNEVDSFGCGYCGTGGFGGAGGMGGFGGGGFGGGGMGGTGGGVFCANGQFCTSVQVPQAPIVLPACCPPNAPNACGLDTTQISGIVPLPAACVRKNQPGVPNASCPALMLPQGGALAGCCKPNGVCGNDFSPIELGCVNTAPYNGQPSIPCGTGGAGGTGGMGGVGGTGGTGGFTGSCCQMHPWPGCNDPNIYKCVCSKDMYCCNGQWDSACVSEVDSLGCGKCGGTGGAGGTGGVSGAGGTGGACNPANCQLPPPMLGCCVTPTGPCGAVTPNGCQPF